MNVYINIYNIWDQIEQLKFKLNFPSGEQYAYSSNFSYPKSMTLENFKIENEICYYNNLFFLIVYLQKNNLRNVGTLHIMIEK